MNGIKYYRAKYIKNTPFCLYIGLFGTQAIFRVGSISSLENDENEAKRCGITERKLRTLYKKYGAETYKDEKGKTVSYFTTSKNALLAINKLNKETFFRLVIETDSTPSSKLVFSASSVRGLSLLISQVKNQKGINIKEARVYQADADITEDMPKEIWR